MNRLLSTAALAALASFFLADTAAAIEVPRPPAVLSPDLTDPWLLQLKPGQKRVGLSPPQVTRSALFAPPSIAPPAAAPAARPARAPTPPMQQTMVTIPGASAAARQYRLDPEFLPRVVPYQTDQKPGTIVIDTPSRHLYLVMPNGQALRYGVGVGRPGFSWAGIHTITRTAEWPGWTPPAEMLQRQPNLPRHMDGGPDNPLGARALYLGSTLYRIHGSNEPWTIGHAVSSGCIRMRNEDIIDLYQRVGVGTKVMVI
jgi:lipoprotein-anchoring transpeptidase ErfK/SrfK